jgi:hypothetical protein
MRVGMGLVVVAVSTASCQRRRPPPPPPAVQVQPTPPLQTDVQPTIPPPPVKVPPPAPGEVRCPPSTLPRRRGQGGLMVTSTPPAHICLNGALVGVTPLRLGALGAGDYEVTFVYPSGPVTQAVSLAQGQHLEIHQQAAP